MYDIGPSLGSNLWMGDSPKPKRKPKQKIVYVYKQPKARKKQSVERYPSSGDYVKATYKGAKTTYKGAKKVFGFGKKVGHRLSDKRLSSWKDKIKESIY